MNQPVLTRTFILLILAMVAGSAVAQSLAWRFDTDGDFQGWKPDNWESVAVKGGAVQGVSKYDPMLASPPLEIDASRYGIIEFRVRSSMTGGGEIFWRGAEERFSEERMSRHVLQAAPEPRVYRVNMAADPLWRGTIAGIRLDLLNLAGAELALDYVRFIERMPGAVPNESFEDDFDADGRPDEWTAQAGAFSLSTEHATDGDRSVKVATGADGKSVLRTRAPLDLLGLYRLEADLTLASRAADARISLIFYDVFGQKLSGEPFILSAAGKTVAGASGQPARLAAEFLAPARAAAADLVLTVTGQNVTAWWDTIRLTHVREDLDLSSAPLETWRASWIWAPATFGKDAAPAYLRKSFDLPAPLAQIHHARAQLTADDKYQLHVNGKLVQESQDTDGWRTPEVVDLKPYLVEGRNVLAIEARDVSSAEGFLFEGMIQSARGDLELLSDGTWKGVGDAPEGWQQPGFDDAAWPGAKVIAIAGREPWGNLPYTYLGRREVVQTAKVDLPATVQAGDRVQFAVTLPRLPQAAQAGPPRWALLHEGQPIVSGATEPRKLPQGWQLGPQTLNIRRFLPPGQYEIALGYPRTEYVSGGGLAIGKLTVRPPDRPEAPVRAEIKRHNGLPTLFLNGQPNSFMHYLEITVGASRIMNMGDNGLHLYEIDAVDMGWKGPDQFDYSDWDRRVLELLTYDPQAVIIPTYDLSGLRHRFWMDANPDELCRDATGSTEVGIYNAKGKIISIASQKWWQEAGAAHKRFVDHCSRAPWAGRIIGYQPCSGVSWEWQHWGSVGPFEPTDYSEPMQQAFREWTQRKYGGDVAKLRQAWNQPEIAFETVQVPPVAVRDGADHLAFRDPSKSGYVIDFYRFHQDIMVDGIEHAFRVVKDATQGRALCGTYYGYEVTMLGGARRAGDSGHFALLRLLQSPLCDFLMSPFDYSNRALGEPYTVMGPLGSVLAHDKLWVLQADLRTHLVTDPVQRRHGSPDSLQGTVSQLQRAFANATAKGVATQWYDFSHGWIARDARQGQVIGKLREISQQWVNWPDRGPDPESVAVIIDEDSPSAFMGHEMEINFWLVYQQKGTFERLGAPWNIYLLDDVVSGKLPKFRCYFFLNCFHMSGAEREWIQTNLQRDRRTLVWMYAPGYVTERDLSLEAMNELTGMRFAERAEAAAWRMTLDAKHPLTRDLGAVTQPNIKVGPVFAPGGEGLDTAAVWEGTALPALAVRTHPQWTSVYSAGPLLSPTLLKRLCTAAGVPVTVPGDRPSYVSRNLIGLHAAVDQTEALQFPRPVTVRDLMTGEVLGRKVTSLEVKLQGPQTRLLRVE